MLGEWRGTVHDSAALPVRPGRSERLVDLVLATGGQRYLCGTGGARYVDQKQFADAGVDVEYFAPPMEWSAVWQSANRVSALWALMTIGPWELRRELRSHASRLASAPCDPGQVAT